MDSHDREWDGFDLSRRKTLRLDFNILAVDVPAVGLGRANMYGARYEVGLKSRTDLMSFGSARQCGEKRP